MKASSSLRTPLATLFIALAFVVGCAGNPQAVNTPSASVQAIAEAKQALARAHAVGYEWRDTGKILKEAEEAAQKGDEQSAVALAGTAKVQAELAVKQYELEKGMDRSRSM